MTSNKIKQIHKMIAEYIERHPDMTYKAMSQTLGVSVPHLSKIALKHGIRRSAPMSRFTVNDDLIDKLAE